MEAGRQYESQRQNVEEEMDMSDVEETKLVRPDSLNSEARKKFRVMPRSAWGTWMMLVPSTQIGEPGGKTSLGREMMVSGLLDRLSERSMKYLSHYFYQCPQNFINTCSCLQVHSTYPHF